MNKSHVRRVASEQCTKRNCDEISQRNWVKPQSSYRLPADTNRILLPSLLSTLKILKCIYKNIKQESLIIGWGKCNT